jgi:enamine deaminase RidA (YjgF/YER057c/UK114 family)
MSILKINPTSLYDATPSGMSQATISTKLGLVFVSGQVDWSLDHKNTSGTMAGQTRAAMDNLKTVLKASGSSIDKLLQVRVYVRGEVAEHLEEIGPVLNEYLKGSLPALTGVGVSSLASPELLIEIEAIAEQ